MLLGGHPTHEAQAGSANAPACRRTNISSTLAYEREAVAHKKNTHGAASGCYPTPPRGTHGPRRL